MPSVKHSEVFVTDCTVERTLVSEGYDGTTCWMHPHAGLIPEPPVEIILTMQKWLCRASDVFMAVDSFASADNGRTWTALSDPAQPLARRVLPDGLEEGICDFTPKWHAASRALLGTGYTAQYRNDTLFTACPRYTAWSVFNRATQTWSPWQRLQLPAEPRFSYSGAGHSQRVDLPNGDILLPVHARAIADKNFFTTVLRCTFDGSRLAYAEHGSELTLPEGRGLQEPSLTQVGSRFYLTMRNNADGYVSVSEDGLHYTTPKAWTFDDGQPLGSDNTQTHWVTHAGSLFLCYTRKGADNASVFRSRAPLFIAQVDLHELQLIRATEKVLVPNLGAQLGNFGANHVSPQESWVTTSEGMAPAGADKGGANGRVYIARLHWATPDPEWHQR